MDLSAYRERVRSGGCFICGMLRGDPAAEHELLHDDGRHVAICRLVPSGHASGGSDAASGLAAHSSWPARAGRLANVGSGLEVTACPAWPRMKPR